MFSPLWAWCFHIANFTIKSSYYEDSIRPGKSHCWEISQGFESHQIINIVLTYISKQMRNRCITLIYYFTFYTNIVWCRVIFAHLVFENSISWWWLNWWVFRYSLGGAVSVSWLADGDVTWACVNVCRGPVRDACRSPPPPLCAPPPLDTIKRSLPQ